MFDFTNPAVFLSLAGLPAGRRRTGDRIPSRDAAKRSSGSRSATTIVVFLMSLCMIFGWSAACKFQAGVAEMQNLFAVDWIPSFSIQYLMGIDGISFPLVVLTAFLSVLAMGASWPIKKHVKAYCILFLLLETGMLGVFCALDFFLFYVFWEVMLLPMYFLIGIWGGPRKEYAAIKFFLYTLLGSVLMLIAILMLYFNSDLRKLDLPTSSWPPASSAHSSTKRPGKPSVQAIRQRAATPQHTFNILALQQMGQHTDLFTDANAGGGHSLAVVGVRAAVHRLRHQGAQRAAAHLVARCARRSSDADLDDPGRRAAEDGRLRHHPHLLSDLSRRPATTLRMSCAASAS